MMETDVLTKIHEDLEILKHDMAEIKEARERIAKGQFVSNEDILKEFDVE